jgi:hypothetical protein
MYGAEGARTPDLLGAIQALSQLSYSPMRTLNLDTQNLHGNPDKNKGEWGVGSGSSAAPPTTTPYSPLLVYPTIAVPCADASRHCPSCRTNTWV